MSSDAPGPRPRQVTIGGWLSAIASTMLVVSVFDAMAELHSVDTRDRLTRALGSGMPKDLGISLDDAISLTRGALFVAGVAAVFTAVLGIFVLQRHASARIGLTVAAVPVVLTSPVAGGFLGLLIGGATAMLWTREARDWFAGRAPARREEWPRPGQHRPAVPSPPEPFRAPDPATSSPPQSPPAPPRPVPDWGQPPADRASWAPPAYPAPRSTAAPVPAGRTVMPREVQIAAFLTWVFSAVTAVAYVALIVAIAVDRDGVLELLRDNAALRNSSLSDSELVGLILAVSAVLLVWCGVAAFLAALTWRRHPAAWGLLVASAAGSFLLALAALPYSLLHVGAAAATFVLLVTRSTRAWIQRHRGRPATPAAAPPSGWPPPDPGSQLPGSDADASARPPGKPPVW